MSVVYGFDCKMKHTFCIVLRTIAKLTQLSLALCSCGTTLVHRLEGGGSVDYSRYHSRLYCIELT